MADMNEKAIEAAKAPELLRRASEMLDNWANHGNARSLISDMAACIVVLTALPCPQGREEIARLQSALTQIANFASIAWQSDQDANLILKELGRQIAIQCEAAGMVCEEGHYEFVDDAAALTALSRTAGQEWREQVRIEADKIISGLRREHNRPFSGFDYGPIEAVEKLRDALLIFAPPVAESKDKSNV